MITPLEEARTAIREGKSQYEIQQIWSRWFSSPEGKAVQRKAFGILVGIVEAAMADGETKYVNVYERAWYSACEKAGIDRVLHGKLRDTLRGHELIILTGGRTRTGDYVRISKKGWDRWTNRQSNQ